MTEIEKEFIRWIIIRDSIFVASFSCSAVFLLRLGVRKWKLFLQDRNGDEVLPILCFIGVAVLSFLIQQNILGIVKAAATPHVYVQTYSAFDDPYFRQRLNGKEVR